jgi:hypothetical protein
LPPRRVPHISPRFCGEMWEISRILTVCASAPSEIPWIYLERAANFPHLPTKQRREIWGTRPGGKERPLGPHAHLLAASRISHLRHDLKAVPFR